MEFHTIPDYLRSDNILTYGSEAWCLSEEVIRSSKWCECKYDERDKWENAKARSDTEVVIV